jgi:hypothetical protein
LIIFFRLSPFRLRALLLAAISRDAITPFSRLPAFIIAS